MYLVGPGYCGGCQIKHPANDLKLYKKVSHWKLLAHKIMDWGWQLKHFKMECAILHIPEFQSKIAKFKTGL